MSESPTATAGSPAGAPVEPSPRTGLLFNAFSLDTRSLSFFRVVLASLVLVDLWNRWPHVEAHYTDFGVLPRAEYVTNFMGKFVLCFHMWGGTAFAMKLLMVVQAAFTLLFLVGWRTRLMHFLSWLFLISLHTRNPYVLQGGDILLRQLFFWSMFLPLGAHWSFDRALNATEATSPPPKATLSMVSFAYLMQVCLVYWYTAKLKTGEEWRDGSAVWYALNIDHFSTPVAEFLLQFPPLLELLTHVTLWFEWLGPLLALMPIGSQFFRGVAVLGFLGLHAGFGFGLKIGLFVFVSCTSWLPMIPSAFWDRLGRWVDGRRRGEAVIAYDGDCGYCRRMAQLVSTGLLLRRTRVVPASVDSTLAARLEASNSWVYVDHDGGVHVEGAAIIAAVRASPIFFWMAPLLALLPRLVNAVYSFVRSRRGAFGQHPSFLRERPQSWSAPRIVQPIAAFLLVYVVMWNNGTLPEHRVKVFGYEVETALQDKYSFFNGAIEIENAKALGYTLRLDQKWDMFAPRPMKGDGWFVIAGTTRKGKVVNLWGESETVVWAKPEVVSATYPGQRWRKYMMNLWMNTFKKHRKHYGRYVCRLFDRDRADAGDKLETFHMFYMKEETERHGTAPVECRSIWQHWCSDNGKNTKHKPYADTCDQYNVRAAAQKAARAACRCDGSDPKCWDKARAKHKELATKREKTKVTNQAILTEISAAEAEYGQCISKAPPASGGAEPPRSAEGEPPR